MKALQAALFPDDGGNERSDYRRAQGSMDRLDRLESALWEAHRREASAATEDETQKMQVHNVDLRLTAPSLDGVEKNYRRA